MSEFFIDTSYKRQYVVVSATPQLVVLRPLDEDAINSYWRTFISASIDIPIPEDLRLPTLHITQLPPEVLSVDAYVDYTLEYPRVEVHYGKVVIDVSDRICVNHPNPETPGLYALDFMVSATGEKPMPIWRSWLSIEEPPLLRRIITPWNRSNRTIADINRLLIEPQFTEALYEAGIPIYNFQQSNSNTSVSQFASQRYKHARAFVKDGGLFISGPRLPSGTCAVIGGSHIFIRDSILCAPFNRSDAYSQGDVTTYCGSDYYALDDIPLVDVQRTQSGDTLNGSLIPSANPTSDSPTQYWLQGAYYNIEGSIPGDGECTLDYLWACVDVNGYLFKMDLLRAFPIRHYWGHYNHNNFMDYAPGDLVSIVKDGIISLYQRNETSLDSDGLDASYRPGHYKNPHWQEVYSESDSTEIIDPVIRPYTNATNAIVCKTYSAREESFRIYSNLVGIPSELVELLGAKYSVLLWAILYRTRETFPGIKTALNAIGLDINNLHRSKSSVIYFDERSNSINDVYKEIEVLKEISKSIEADRIWVLTNGSNPPEDPEYSFGMPPWIAYTIDGRSVIKYDSKTKTWVPYYTFTHIGSDLQPQDYDYSVNNRYYEADLNLLDRLSKSGALDLDDGFQWIDHNYFVALSLALTRLLSYEIPIYVYFRLKVHLAAICKTHLRGVSNGVVMHDAWGGTVGVKLYPGKLFNFATCTTEYYYPNLMFSYEKLPVTSSDSDWTLQMDYIQRDGYRYYSFDHAVYIRLAYPMMYNGLLFRTESAWTSQFTIGCLGDSNSPGTDDYLPEPSALNYQGFKDASLMGTGSNPMKSPDYYLCKGIVGCTLRIATSTINATASCLQWNYIFDDPTWIMDETLKFADWKVLDGVKFIGYWSSDIRSFKASITRISSPDSPDAKFVWGTETEPTLYIGGVVPDKVMMYDIMGYLRGMLIIPYSSRMVIDGDGDDYLIKVELSI